MIVFLRGLPGSGKTTIAKLLSEKTGWKVVSVDEYKKELMRERPEADFVTEIVPASYEKALAEIGSKNSDMIVEELLRDGDFVRRLAELCAQKGIEARWFRIVRDASETAAVNEGRKREIKNSPEVLAMMDGQIRAIEIPSETVIENVSAQKSADLIFESLPPGSGSGHLSFAERAGRFVFEFLIDIFIKPF